MFAFRADTIPSNIFVVGCGGTGSRLIPSLVQFIRSITKEHVPSGWLGNTNIILIDGDTVEQKNLIRQNFIQNDVNKNKAAVLANRYGKHFGMNVLAYPHFIEEGEDTNNLRTKILNTTGVNTKQGTDLVIMCVDSAKARRFVLHSLCPFNGGKSIFIDAGNEDSFGQVRMFTNTVLIEGSQISREGMRKAYKVPDRIEIESPILGYIPYDHEFYENLQDNPGLGSCADLDQTLAINSLMAMYILSFVQNLYYRKVIDYNEVSIDIVKGSTAYTKNTITNYRNKAILTTSANGVVWTQAGSGYRFGIIGTCEGDYFKNIFDEFVLENTKAVSKLLKEQEKALLAEKKKGEKPEPVDVEEKTLEVEAEPKRKRGSLKSGPASLTEVTPIETPRETLSNFRQLVQAVEVTEAEEFEEVGVDSNTPF